MLKTVIIVCGPTAVGKTSVAINLAKTLQTEIISADSRQCYKELNIGVAKPSILQLEEVQHFFINSHSIHENVNAAVFERYALEAVEKIFQKNDVAVMVGGTGLYIKAFCEGLDAIPEVDETIRLHVNELYKSNGLEYLQKELAEKDPVFWQTSEQQNPRRLMRALEVLLATGKSISDFRSNQKVNRPFKIVKIGLELPREELYNHINTRVDKMIEQGLVTEVKSLIPFKNIKALQTVGYAELFEYFDQKCDLEQAIKNIKTNTRHYAKRQMTWFKKDPEIFWQSPQEPLNNLIAALQI